MKKIKEKIEEILEDFSTDTESKTPIGRYADQILALFGGEENPYTNKEGGYGPVIPYPSKQDWEKEFDERFDDWNFHHKDLVCFHDSVAEHAIKSFIKSLLAEEKEKYKQEILERLPKEKEFWPGSIQINDSFTNGCNSCLRKIKEILKDL